MGATYSTPAERSLTFCTLYDNGYTDPATVKRKSTSPPTPFGSKKWQYACLEALQRLVALKAIQFILFEPVDRVKGNEEVQIAVWSRIAASA